MKKVLQVFPKQIPYEVFLSGGEDLLVKLSDLKKAGTVVSVVPTAAHAASGAPKRVLAEVLKTNWLRTPQDCKSTSCWKSPPDVRTH